MKSLSLPVLMVTAIAVIFGCGSAATAELPVYYGNDRMLQIAHTDWDGAVSGANDYSCTASVEHPEPVVLVGSTFLSAAVNWTALAPYLYNHGFCVFTLNYGRSMYRVPPGLNGMDPMPMSASELGALVDRVLAATGASKVDLVAHSQGGLVARYFVNETGGEDKVDQVVLLSSPYTMTGLPVDVAAVASEVIPKPLYDAILYNGLVPPLGLNFLDPWSVVAAQVLRPNIRYTQITGRADEIGFFGGMRAPDGAVNTTTQYIDDICPTDFSQHFAQPYSPTAVALIGNALDPAHPVPPPCTLVPLYSLGQG
ncbi:alpha/beta fold hydrolase [Nocardia sp. NPDC050710]|uniref:esterase/lipase family protein n=1 Tax=Nocardia sp. NPDC050710 TaxID=3157220 RepID=UPI0033E78E57